MCSNNTISVRFIYMKVEDMVQMRGTQCERLGILGLYRSITYLVTTSLIYITQSHTGKTIMHTKWVQMKTITLDLVTHAFL